MGFLFAQDLPATDATVASLRAVRIIGALSVGAALAISGLLLQSLTRNELAEPGLLGISSGAGLAVVLYTALFPGELTLLSSTGAAIVGAVVSGTMAFALAGGFSSVGASKTRLILSGAVLALLFAALTTTVLSLDTNTLGDTRVWLAGSLADRPPNVVVPLGVIILIVALLAWAYSGRFTILSMGDETATGLGIDPLQTRVLSLLFALCFAGLAVAIAGPIGFVGLIAPHVARSIVGGRLTMCLPVAVLVGAALLLFSDAIVRILAPPAEAPVGVATLLIGAPFFLLILRRGA